MNFIRLEKFYIFLFSIIPLSIIIGPTISLLNILFLGLFFFICPLQKNNNLYKNQLYNINFYLFLPNI